MLHATDHVDGKILWANMHFLFWLSLVPFVTGWMSENEFARVPTALYGFVLLMSAIGYKLLQTAIIAHTDANHLLRDAIGRDIKGIASILLYMLALPLAIMSDWIAIVLYAFVALAWLVPDRRIEKKHGHRAD